MGEDERVLDPTGGEGAAAERTTAGQHDAAQMLSNRKHRAIDLMVAGVPRIRVAETIGVARSTLYTWLNSPAFVVELNRRQTMVRDELGDEVVALFRLAVRAAAAAIEAGDAKAALGVLRLIDFDRVLAPPTGPASLEDLIERETDRQFRSSEHKLLGELTMRTVGSTMDEAGDGRDVIRAECAEAVHRRVELDVATEQAAIDAEGREYDPPTNPVPSVTGVPVDPRPRVAPTAAPIIYESDRLFPVDEAERAQARSTGSRSGPRRQASPCGEAEIA